MRIYLNILFCSKKYFSSSVSKLALLVTVRKRLQAEQELLFSVILIDKKVKWVPDLHCDKSKERIIWLSSRTWLLSRSIWIFPGGSEVKVSACNEGDPGLIPGSGRSPGEENGNPLQYSCLENPIYGGPWWATVHGVAKSRTRLSDFTSLYFTWILPLTSFS